MKACFNHIQRHAYTMFNSIRIYCLVHVYTLFEDTFRLFLKTCLYNVWSDIFVMFKDMVIPCLKLFYTMYEDIKQIFFYLSISFFLLIYTLYEDMFTQRHPVDGIFTKCLNPYSFKIDPIVLVVENGYKFQIKSF